MKDDKLWKVFSEYIRLRDADKFGYITCITCGKRHYWEGTRQVNAGHFISRRFNSTKYDERNCSAQCVNCNKYNDGKQYEHSIAIDKKFGQGTAQELYLKSKQFSRALNKFEIDTMTKHYKEQIAKLKKEKGIM